MLDDDLDAVVAFEVHAEAAEAPVSRRRRHPLRIWEHLTPQLTRCSHLVRLRARHPDCDGQAQVVDDDGALRAVEPVLEMTLVERRAGSAALDDLAVDFSNRLGSGSRPAFTRASRHR